MLRNQGKSEAEDKSYWITLDFLKIPRWIIKTSLLCYLPLGLLKLIIFLQAHVNGETGHTRPLADSIITEETGMNVQTIRNARRLGGRLKILVAHGSTGNIYWYQPFPLKEETPLEVARFIDKERQKVKCTFKHNRDPKTGKFVSHKAVNKTKGLTGRSGKQNTERNGVQSAERDGEQNTEQHGDTNRCLLDKNRYLNRSVVTSNEVTTSPLIRGDDGSFVKSLSKNISLKGKTSATKQPLSACSDEVLRLYVKTQGVEKTSAMLIASGFPAQEIDVRLAKIKESDGS